MNHQQDLEKDELRARFTRWLEVTLHRAKVDYVRKLEREKKMVYVEQLPEEYLVEDQAEAKWIRSFTDTFDFEEDQLAHAFYRLTILRQKILTMLFVEEKSPNEIADQLGCSVRHVYKQRSLALDKLREMLEKDGEENE